MNKTKPSVESIAIGRIGGKRPSSSRRPSSVSQFHIEKMQLVVLELFKKYDYEPIDLEALIFCTLQRFDVSAHTYESMYKVVRRYIIANFRITQGKHLLLQDVSMRRMMVSCSHTE